MIGISVRSRVGCRLGVVLHSQTCRGGCQGELEGGELDRRDVLKLAKHRIAVDEVNEWYHQCSKLEAPSVELDLVHNFTIVKALTARPFPLTTG